jgi:hypothetical protein
VVTRYRVGEGVPLAVYLPEFFGEYMADETFALSLVHHLARGLVSARTFGPFDAAEVWLGAEGEVRLLRPSGRADERACLRAIGELLFQLLTRQDPSPATLHCAREVNGEITSSAETVIRRSVQSVAAGGYGGVASLCQAVGEVLRGRGVAVGGDVIPGFQVGRAPIEFRREVDRSVEDEARYLEALRAGPATRFERVLRRLFGAPERHGLRPLWIPFALGYLALVTPLYFARLSSSALLMSLGGFSALYVGVFAAISSAYRRTRD